MLKIKHRNVVLDLQNQNIEPRKWVIACGPIKKKKGHSKINDQIKRNMYACITRHPQVVQSPICNDFLKVIFDDQTEPQLVPKLLLQVSVRELQNSLVSDPIDGSIKYTRYEENNIIISDYKVCSLFPPQVEKITHDTRSCVVVNVGSLLKVYIHHCYPGVVGI